MMPKEMDNCLFINQTAAYSLPQQIRAREAGARCHNPRASAVNRFYSFWKMSTNWVW